MQFFKMLTHLKLNCLLRGKVGSDHLTNICAKNTRVLCVKYCANCFADIIHFTQSLSKRFYHPHFTDEGADFQRGFRVGIGPW